MSVNFKDFDHLNQHLHEIQDWVSDRVAKTDERKDCDRANTAAQDVKTALEDKLQEIDDINVD